MSRSIYLTTPAVLVNNISENLSKKKPGTEATVGISNHFVGNGTIKTITHEFLQYLYKHIFHC